MGSKGLNHMTRADVVPISPYVPYRVREKDVRISVVVPVFNEQGNIRPLCERLFEVLGTLGLPFEVIAVNDGSRDGSLEALRSEARRYSELKIVDLPRNYGQTAAIMAGIDH